MYIMSGGKSCCVLSNRINVPVGFQIHDSQEKSPSIIIALNVHDCTPVRVERTHSLCRFE